MPDSVVQKVDYTQRYADDHHLWHTPESLPHPALQTLLAAVDHLIILRHGQPPYEVVLGVPHHVPSGIWRICERRYDEQGHLNDRRGDDNVASYALVAFSRLAGQGVPCKLVIMAHPTTQDPNKVLNSPYCREIFREETKLLFECHASSGQRLLDLELSAGGNPLTRTLTFGQILAERLRYSYSLGVQTVAGHNQALIFHPGGRPAAGLLQLPALKTTSLREAGQRGIEALHLEAKPLFRVAPYSLHAVSPDGLILGRALAEATLRYLEL